MNIQKRLERLEVNTANEYGGFEGSSPENITATAQQIEKDIDEIINSVAGDFPTRNVDHTLDKLRLKLKEYFGEK